MVDFRKVIIKKLIGNRKSQRRSQWLISTIQQQFRKTSKRRSQLDASDIV